MIARALGSAGPRVAALGLGCMGMSDFYGPADEAESIATIHAALDAGVTLLDTGDYYGMGHNELLLREALRGRDRGGVVLSDRAVGSAQQPELHAPARADGGGPRRGRAGGARRRRRGRPLPCTADRHPRQRARRSRHEVNESALTPDRILEAAEDVLRRFGPAKATVVDVARALGVSHGSLYRHFPSKAALRDAVTERWLARVSVPLAAVADEDGPAPERLRRWLDLLVASKRRMAREDPELFATYNELAREAREVVRAHVDTLVAQLAGIVADGVARGELQAGDPAAAGRAVFDATARFHNPVHAPEWSDPRIDAAVEGVWSLVLNGLAQGRSQGVISTPAWRSSTS